jgi:tetratricopeptide (TPR) repeat protein
MGLRNSLVSLRGIFFSTYQSLITKIVSSGYALLAMTFIFIVANSSSAANNPVKDLFEQATLAYSQKEYDKSIQLYEQLIKVYPNFAPAYNYMGLAHKAKPETNLSSITWMFEKAIEITPDYVDPYDNLGKIYYSLGNFDKAEEFELKALAIKPDFPTAHLTLGWVYLLGKSQPEEAIKHFSQVGQTDIPYAHLGLGIAYYMDGQNFRVLEMITSLRKLGREDLALQLEKALKRGRYIPGETGMPLISPGTSQKPDEELTFSDNENVKQMPVRLRSKTEETPPAASPPPSQPAQNLSAQERLQQLRQKGIEAQKR